MQINRLFEIVYILMNKKHTTANELAAHFEVSKRTILRDIDTLTTAGIPIYTTQGKGGGVFIQDRFLLNKTFVSEAEQKQILFSLQSMSATELVGKQHKAGIIVIKSINNKTHNIRHKKPYFMGFCACVL